jgi:UDP-N-acetylglucosamine 2-epimerase
MVGLNIERVMQALSILKEQSRSKNRTVFEVSDYKASNVSEKVVRIIHSYTDYVNRNIWNKSNN